MCPLELVIDTLIAIRLRGNGYIKTQANIFGLISIAMMMCVKIVLGPK